MSEELAVVQNPGFGMRDFDQSPRLWFEVRMLGGASLLTFDLETAAEMIRDADAYDVASLNRRMCVVENNDGLIRFVRWHK